MSAKRLTTALFAATALSAAATPAAHAAIPHRPFCTPAHKMACQWPCSPQLRGACQDDRPSVMTRARSVKGANHQRWLPTVDRHLLATPQNGCHTAVGAAAPC